MTLLVDSVLDRASALVGEPPNDGSTTILRFQQSLIREVVESGECSLIRKPDLISDFSGKEDRVFRLEKDLEDLVIFHCFLAASWHRSQFCTEGTYYQVLDASSLETN